jgi:hypothetical protein
MVRSQIDKSTLTIEMFDKRVKLAFIWEHDTLLEKKILKAMTTLVITIESKFMWQNYQPT